MLDAGECSLIYSNYSLQQTLHLHCTVPKVLLVFISANTTGNFYLIKNHFLLIILI